MLESFNDSIKKHLVNNIWVYIIVISLFILGICLGAITVNIIDETAKADAKNYIDGFIDITANESLQTAFILKQSIKFNLYFTVAVFLSGLIYLGILIIPILIAFRGFCIGFSIAFLTESLGKGGFLFSIASILPQNIIYVPVLIMLGVLSLNNSVLTLRNKYIKKYNTIPSQLASYAFSSLMLLILLVAGCIVEAYITSSLVKVITPYIS
ncbi:MAG: stage II sporulation protein M [Caulobacteraceae bacterium]